MRKFKGIDIIKTLKKIVDNNNLYYQSDFNYDIEKFKSAKPFHGCYIWMSHNDGTWCFNERDVYIRNSHTYNTWSSYSINDSVKIFSIVVTSNYDETPYGNIYELNYQNHIDEVSKNSFSAVAVDITYKPPFSAHEIMRTFDIVEYNKNWHSIVQKYGKFLNMEYKIEDNEKLENILESIREERDKTASDADMDVYITDIVKERFRSYGYLHDDMEFTTSDDACNAVKYNIPVYALHTDNTNTLINYNNKIDSYIYSGCIFGMKKSDKQLLDLFSNENPLTN